ncbi:MAG: hypothetical protein Q9M92_13650 [Enterobacterales bacterium]|nr:hypothetical protein [Enterobacterales bacterium]
MTKVIYKVLLVVAILCLNLGIIQAKDKELILFYSSASPFSTSNQVNLPDLLTQQIPQLSQFSMVRSVDIESFTVAQLETILNNSQQCAITLGEKSLKTILSTRPKKRIFSLMVAKYELDKLIQLYTRFGIELSGIYQEQSFVRQLNLVRAINPEAKHIAIALGLKTRYWLDEYQALSDEYSLQLIFNLFNLQSNLPLFVEKINAEKTFLLVVNDPDVYSPLQLQSILVSSYNRQIPIIGNKLSDSENAALASVYTPNELLASEVSQKIDSFCKAIKIAAPNFSDNYQVMINPAIAQSLNYSSLDNKILKSKMKLLEPRIKEVQ